MLVTTGAGLRRGGIEWARSATASRRRQFTTFKLEKSAGIRGARIAKLFNRPHAAARPPRETNSMSYDLLIKNGTVVDGTGAASRRADVGIANGQIAEIGKITRGREEDVIDASDLIVSPGFVDPHTHYDAQICWDPYITSSSWHGVTTVMMGNCGVGIAPCKPEVREIAAWDLVNVEAIPFDVLSKGINWEWETFPEYMDAAEKRGSGINLGFLAPLTPFRHYVMGEESMERAATADETAQDQGR